MRLLDSEITFPAIDFKFRNTGRSAAVLWQYSVEVFEAEVDPTPELQFQLSVNTDSLIVTARNNGWGPAKSCTFSLSDPILDRLCPELLGHFTGSIPSGDEKI